jgi:hypothetical protein
MRVCLRAHAPLISICIYFSVCNSLRIIIVSSNETERRMASSGMLSRVFLVRTDVLEERIISITRVKRIGALLLTLFLARRFLSSWWWRRYLHRKRPFLQQPHGVTSQKTAFFIATAVKTSNLTRDETEFVPYKNIRNTFDRTDTCKRARHKS